MKIALITAGGAGMFCGSCMQDNTMVRALRLGGADAMLIPTYTPIRVDEENQSSSRVFLGGLNVYLGSSVPGWSSLPAKLTNWLNHPRLIQWLSRLAGSTDAKRLGSLTVDLLRGSHGPQQRAITELVNYLCYDFCPDIILFSNALLSGIVPSLRQRYSGPIVTLLQGDDVFLDALPDRYRKQAIELVSQNSQHFDGILCHSQYYVDFMQAYLNLPQNVFQRIPLTIDVTVDNGDLKSSGFTIGYFARICPEKGVDRLLDAAVQILPKHKAARIVIAGFLPAQHRRWFQEKLQQAQRQCGSTRIVWLGSPAARIDKYQILRSFNLLCVPTRYREPKGLYVLEAGLVGVPSLLPDHGAFPEMIAELGAGSLFSATDEQDLVQRLSELCDQHDQSQPYPSRPNLQLIDSVVAQHSISATAPQLFRIFSRFCENNRQ